MGIHWEGERGVGELDELEDADLWGRCVEGNGENSEKPSPKSSHGETVARIFLSH